MLDKYYEIAINILNEITNTEEKTDAIIFYNDNLKQDGCIVILKKDYKILTMTEYIIMSDEINGKNS